MKLTVEDLKKRQSVRATFKLSQEVVDLLGIIAGQLGIKQKSLLDHLIEDPSQLDQAAQEARGYCPPGAERRQKTYVMSRSTLRSINTVARKKKIPRDLLVEISIKRLLPIAENELAKHKKRKLILEEMIEHMHRELKLLKKTQDLLGENDILTKMLKNQLSLVRKNISEVDLMIEKGMVMEDW